LLKLIVLHVYGHPFNSFDVIMFRPPPEQGIRLRIHHMGELLQKPFKMYIKGKVDEMDLEWDVDYISHYKLEELVKCEEKYDNIKCMWY